MSQHFVKCFIAVLGPRVSSIPLAFPECLGWEANVEVELSSSKILSFGETQSTLSISLSVSSKTWIKGRPFLLSGNDQRYDWNHNNTRALETALTNLDGKFSLVSLNPSGSLICATDLIGAGSLFYAENEGHLFVSSHLGTLIFALGKPYEDDPEGIASILMSCASIDGSTPVRGIRRLMHGQYLIATWNNGSYCENLNWSIKRYAELETTLIEDSGTNNTPDNAIVQLDQIFSESLTREFDGDRANVMLSGGRDSKAIVLGLKKRKHIRIDAMTYGERNSSDRRRATILASELGINHHLIPYDDWRVETYADKVIALMGGAIGFQVIHMVTGFDYARQMTQHTTVGFLGDALTGNHLPHQADIDFNSVLKIICHKLWEKDYDADIHQSFPTEVNKLITKLMERYNSMVDLAPYQRAILLDLSIRQGTWISSAFDMAEYFVEISYPFYYRPLMKFLINQPFSMLQDQKLYDQWLRRAYLETSPLIFVQLNTFMSKVMRRLKLTRFAEVNGNLDWKKRIEYSRPWLKEKIESFQGTSRLQTVCHESFKKWNKNSVPIMLLGLAINEAKTLGIPSKK
ncbi:7-cyano-7-deazaguanine synthase [Nostoc sp. CHAB 5836]|uniref:asparagine synthase-related protein n=1 Tax=Nostoc sp. CHAB 5836 TaxID=2780404 RepID=UPI001E480283|nr:asparagine synthase-related protein [Nostoc sp. CHAB 5836]MCC5618308.1 7-cyano-7-deazaguanine synthase [Nostoc sp. CHAB 5836]